MKAGTPGAEQLADIHDIQQLLSRYAIALDSRTPELLRACFTEEAHIALGGMPATTPSAYIELCEKTLPELDATQHAISTPLVHLEGGTASSRCYFTAQHARNSLRPDPLFVIGGWYDDALSRTSLGWRITRRIGTAAWCDGNPAVLDFPDLPGGMAWGAGRECPEWLSAT